MPCDPSRIPRVLAALRTAWNCNPDLRLGQLIEDVLPAEICAGRIYEIEDDEWERMLQEYAREEAE